MNTTPPQAGGSHGVPGAPVGGVPIGGVPSGGVPSAGVPTGGVQAGGAPSAAVPVLGDDPGLLDGHTVDELADYLDAGMSPADPTIDESPACQNALAAIVRLRELSRDALDAASLDEDPADDGWVGGILANISLEARAGRDIPLRGAAPTEHSVITEGSVRSLIRRAADDVDGILVGRCVLEGDVDEPGAPIRVRITASVLWGNSIPDVVGRLRTGVVHELLEHTELAIEGIDVEIRDVLLDRVAPSDDPEVTP
ncbi:hypothetical protein [Curtobacterium sp. RRHDQ10]|uniref:hypothetical protein n=1 Tax=Curtobacterium phyllosphaerae TaxID=3413379 RepID=UPI003BF20713